MKTAVLTGIFVFLALHQLVSSVCNFDEYFCKGTGKCIDSDYVCDGDNDCGDSEDEMSCTATTTLPRLVSVVIRPCPSNRFHCPFENRCLNPSWVCDGEEDCLDGVDERVCLTRHIWPTTSSLNPIPTTTQISIDCDNETHCKVPCKSNEARSCYCENGHHLEVQGRNLTNTSMCISHTNNPTLVFILASSDGKSEMLGMDLVTNTTWLYFKRSTNSVMRDVDFDFPSGTLFWNDVQLNIIYSYTPMNNSLDVRMICSTKDSPINIQWDWIAKNLYFVSHRKIKCCDHTLILCSTLHTHEDNVIWDFVIAPKTRCMFWNFLLDRSGTVHRSDMDGSNEVEILHLYGTWHSLAVDHENERLYWASEDGTKIGSSDFNGKNRNGITLQRHFNLLSEIEIFENHLYFVHESQKHVERCSIIDGSCVNLLKLGRNESKIQIIKIVHHSLRPDGENHCLNSRCQELCLPNQLGYTCQCTDTAEKNCESKSVILQLTDPVKFLDEQDSDKTSPDLSLLKWIGCTFLVLCIVAVIVATIVFYFKRRSLLATSRLRKEERQVAAYSNMKYSTEGRVSVGNLVNL